MQYTEKITISNGIIRGYIDEKSGVRIYKGIPYAKAPVGELRFKPTCKAEPFEGVKDCVTFGPSAIQEEQKPFMFWTEEFVIGDYGYSEDCLNLNIWADNDDVTNKPVIVYFHGGRFVSGGSSCENYDGTSFARKGCVFVSFNHRVATLAQLSTKEIYEASNHKNSGNYNLYDAITMLEWVKENIARFGGNPDNVILMGQSSGAGEVNALSVCEQARGLYAKTIALSYNSYIGTIADNGWKELEDAFVQGAELTDNRTLQELLEMPAMDFVAKTPIDTMRVDNNLLKGQFKDLVDHGLNKDVDLIMGAVPGDWLICSPFYHQITETKEQIVEILKKFFGDSYEEAQAYYDIDNANQYALTARINKDYVLSTMLLYARTRNSFHSGRTYIYHFNHVLPGPENGAFGVFHSAELPYFFDYFTDKRKEFFTDKDYALGKTMNGMMVSYAKGEDLSQYGWNPTTDTNYLSVTGDGIKEAVFDQKILALYEKCLMHK